MCHETRLLLTCTVDPSPHPVSPMYQTPFYLSTSHSLQPGSFHMLCLANTVNLSLVLSLNTRLPKEDFPKSSNPLQDSHLLLQPVSFHVYNK